MLQRVGTCEYNSSYKHSLFWRRLHELLPETVRIPMEEFPHEESHSIGRSVVHVDRFENPSANTRIVMFHGLGTNARMLSLVFGHSLARLGYEVVAIDLPYVGGSPTNNSKLVYGDWVNIATEFVSREQRQDAKRTILFGFSVGGMLAVHVATSLENIAGICGTTFLDLSAPQVRKTISSAPFFQSSFENVLRLISNINGDIRIPLKLISNTRHLTDDHTISSRLSNDPLSTNVRLPLRFVKSITEYSNDEHTGQAIRCPVKLLYAKDDTWTPVDPSLDFLKRLNCPTEVESVADSGHLPVNGKAIKQFVDGIDRFASRATCA